MENEERGTGRVTTHFAFFIVHFSFCLRNNGFAGTTGEADAKGGRKS
jgi:hypothetical protein